MRRHKSLFKQVLFGSAIILGAIMVGAIGITLTTNKSQYQPAFMAGKLPAKPLNGFYSGIPLFLIETGTMWQGKIFDATNQTGWNHFTEGNKYPFKTYVTSAIGETRQVLRLDYDVPGNPWYVRIIRDELVQTDATTYLGKLNLDIIPYFPIAVGFFQLQVSAVASGGCVISGCSKELCSDRELFSVCNFKAEYACYRTARCERQKNNQCGWTATNELTQCIKTEKNNK